MIFWTLEENKCLTKWQVSTTTVTIMVSDPTVKKTNKSTTPCFDFPLMSSYTFLIKAAMHANGIRITFAAKKTLVANTATGRYPK